MEGIILELTVTLTTIDDKPLPEKSGLIEKFMDHVREFYYIAGPQTQSVQVTAVNGKQVS